MKVFYNEGQVFPIKKVPLDKIPLLVKLWRENSKLEFLDFPLLSNEDLCLAHSSKYVEGLFKGSVRNGFGNQNPKIAECERYQVSNFVAAAFSALEEGIAVSPTAGFHHATYDFSGMYCVFNALMIAAIKMKKEGKVKKVGILDLDFHYGDGTDHIVDTLSIDYVSHWGFAKNWVPSSFLFFQNLSKGLEKMKDCDIILYQAGMDMYKNDPNGGLLSEEDLRKRDRMVFEFAHKNKIPLVWTLAGGYTELNFLVSLHNITMEECLKVYAK